MNLYRSCALIWALALSGCERPSPSLLSYLSTLPKESKALRFAPGIISTDDYEFALSLSPEMDEVFFTRRIAGGKNQIYHSRWRQNHWESPIPMNFSAEQGWDFEPHINPQGQRLYFGSTRPLFEGDSSTGLHQWYLEKEGANWSKPQVLGSPFLEAEIIMYLSESLGGNRYFTYGMAGQAPQDWSLYWSPKQDSSYPRIEALPSTINFEGHYIAHPYIDPQERFLLFDARQSRNYGSSDLYISFKQEGVWLPAQNLGSAVNTSATEMCPSLSPDGQYLFFHRGTSEEGDIYWIAFDEVLKQLKSKTS